MRSHSPSENQVSVLNESWETYQRRGEKVKEGGGGDVYGGWYSVMTSVNWMSDVSCKTQLHVLYNGLGDEWCCLRHTNFNNNGTASSARAHQRPGNATHPFGLAS